ncbi:NUDIX hydrolase [Litorivivens sp.]|uniref:NUDIX hydrolase n=1 Tax=Litorivivens sp. TaxID=2020868 RepID=UPI0035685A1C
MILHPRRGEDGKPLRLHKPSRGTLLESWLDVDAFAQVIPDGAMPAGLHNVSFKTWADAPSTQEEWEALAAHTRFDEPKFEPKAGRKSAAGVVIQEPDGRVWGFAPSNAYGGYKATFPKGGLDGLSMKAAAIKEAFEETGLKVELVGFLVDVLRTTSYSRYYLARRTGGNPADMGWEAQAVMLVPKVQLVDVYAHPFDARIVAAIST